MINLVVKNGRDLIYEGLMKSDEEADIKIAELKKQYPNLPLNFRKKTSRVMSAKQ